MNHEEEIKARTFELLFPNVLEARDRLLTEVEWVDDEWVMTYSELETHQEMLALGILLAASGRLADREKLTEYVKEHEHLALGGEFQLSVLDFVKRYPALNPLNQAAENLKRAAYMNVDEFLTTYVKIVKP